AGVLLLHPALGAFPEHPPRAQQIPERDPHAVRGDGEGAAEVDPVEDGPRQRGDGMDHGPTVAPGLGLRGWPGRPARCPVRAADLPLRPRGSARPGTPVTWPPAPPPQPTRRGQSEGSPAPAPPRSGTTA